MVTVSMARVSDKRKTAILAPDGWYSDWEIKVTSVTKFAENISKLSLQNPDKKLLWRGVSNANLSLTNSLFRNLTTRSPDGTLIFPTEKQMQEAERRILDHAYKTWRIQKEDSHAVMAQLQHLGAPTRFIDVTKNPYVALWFACGDDWGPEIDGRILAFGSKNEAQWNSIEGNQPSTFLSWDGRDGKVGWGKNSEVKVWFPPIGTHLRVFAQNAGFIYGGLPVFGAGSNSNYLRNSSVPTTTSKYWPSSAVKQATTLHFNPTSFDRKSRADAQKTPCWTMRIPAKYKTSIRESLEKSYGMNRAILFPGLDGFADALNDFDKELTKFVVG